VKPSLLLGGVLAIGGPLAAQSAVGRWSLQIRHESGADHGDLRIDSLGARLLLESRDSAWMPLSGFTSNSLQVMFRLADGRRFEGQVAPDLMQGQVFDGRREVATWNARRIQQGTDRWPVRPRITVRQLMTGRGDTVARFPAPWHGRILSRDALVAEHATLARDAGFAPAGVDEIAARARRTMLGFDADARRAARKLLEQIAATPAADAAFRRLFVAGSNRWRLDLHDAAWQFAVANRGGRAIDSGGVVRLLESVGVRADEAMLSYAVWQVWGRHPSGPLRTALLAGTGDDHDVARAELGALLAGYDTAEEWWLLAVRWLMQSRWVATDAGWQSPIDLVTTFWDRDTLVLPSLEAHHFGTVQAVPVIGAGPIASSLLRAGNAIAEEWLRDPARRDEALRAWRQLEFGDASPLRVSLGEHSMVVASAAFVARSRLGGFMAGRDAIRIEPAIMPVFAISTVVHEWQHLLFERARLVADPTPAFRDQPWGITLVEADPWLGEGAAEWATEAALAPTRAMTPLLALAEMEKRLSIGAGGPEDTHVLGYLLVRAAANRLATTSQLRQALETHLHDPAGFAAAVNLAGAESHEIVRPSTLMLIPEVTFTLDAGVAEGATRRLLIPEPPTEH
jgi:hypothetical protein